MNRVVTGEDRAKAFRFDKLFGGDSGQDDVYDGLNISNLLHKLMEGYHATIFAYGQTGSGKTYTMEG